METPSKIHQLIARAVELNASLWPDRMNRDMLTMDRLTAQAAEEAGEVHGALRSYFGREYSPEKTATLEDVAEELGDVMGLYFMIGAIMEVTPEHALELMVTKLEGRKKKSDIKAQEKFLSDSGKKYFSQCVCSSSASEIYFCPVHGSW